MMRQFKDNTKIPEKDVASMMLRYKNRVSDQIAMIRILNARANMDAYNMLVD